MLASPSVDIDKTGRYAHFLRAGNFGVEQAANAVFYVRAANGTALGVALP